MAFGKSDAVITRRRQMKEALVRGMAETAIRCRNGGRTLRMDETAVITDYLGGLVTRAMTEPELKSVLLTSKGCKSAPAGLITQGVTTLFAFVSLVTSGGCGETFVVDLGRWAKHIVDSNPGNSPLRAMWLHGDFDNLLAQAKRDGENELAEYLRRPAQRQPENWDEALGYLAYWSGDLTADQEMWEGLRETVGDQFEERAVQDSYLKTVLRGWKGDLPRFTYERALKMCTEKYPAQFLAKERLAAAKRH